METIHSNIIHQIISNSSLIYPKFKPYSGEFMIDHGIVDIIGEIEGIPCLIEVKVDRTMTGITNAKKQLIRYAQSINNLLKFLGYREIAFYLFCVRYVSDDRIDVYRISSENIIPIILHHLCYDSEGILRLREESKSSPHLSGNRFFDYITLQRVIKNFPVHKKLLLYSIIACEPSNENDSLTTSKCYEMYKKICDMHSIRPLTNRRIGDLLNDEDMKWLIDKKIISFGRYGRKAIISLKVPINLVYETLNRDDSINIKIEKRNGKRVFIGKEMG